MADEVKHYEPPVHIVPDGDKWGVCLSRAAKWIAGIAAALVTAGFISMITMQITSAIRLAEQGRDVEHINSRVGFVIKRIERLEINVDRRLGWLEKSGKLQNDSDVRQEASAARVEALCQGERCP